MRTSMHRRRAASSVNEAWERERPDRKRRADAGARIVQRLEGEREADEGGAHDEFVGARQRIVIKRHEELPAEVTFVKRLQCVVQPASQPNGEIGNTRARADVIKYHDRRPLAVACARSRRPMGAKRSWA